MDGAARTSIGDLVRIADVAFDDVPACGEVDGAPFAGLLIARQHGGGGGLLVAVGVDVVDGLGGPCPRRCSREQHHEQQHGCPHREMS
ncbi:MAG: hypothetical protein J6N98_07055 [Prevotella sp.]|nr:hypothetical protein [Prevotella sp.]